MERTLIPKTNYSECRIPDTTEYQTLLQQLTQAQTVDEVEKIRAALLELRAKYVRILSSAR